MDQFFIYPKPVIEIRSKYYVSVLLNRLGVERVAHIPRALDELASNSTGLSYNKYRNDFFRYWKGGNIKNMALVSAIDEIFPGTARILRHPIWALLTEHSPRKEEIIQLAQGVETGLQKYILQYDESTGNIWLVDHSRNWRLLRADSPFLKLINRHGFDELATLLLLMRAHEMQDAYGISHRFVSQVYECLIGISRAKEFKPILAELCNLIRTSILSTY